MPQIAPEMTLKRRGLSVEEARQTLGISRATIYRLMAAGKLMTVKLGSRRIIPVVALDALLGSDT
jgi:excisionase family DNA binding protein